MPSLGHEVDVNAGGFALWGGPHILSLVTEVATRGLKAVRYQKFNNHLRLRPEALAGRLEKSKIIDEMYPVTCCAFTKMRDDLKETVAAITDHNDQPSPMAKSAHSTVAHGVQGRFAHAPNVRCWARHGGRCLRDHVEGVLRYLGGLRR